MKKIFTLFIVAAITCTSYKTFAQTVIPQDSLALVDLYDSCNGANWPAPYKWDLTQPVSTWFYVTTTGNRVTTLYTPGGPHLLGQIPPSIGNLDALTDLVLGDSLYGPIPQSIGRLVNLRRLSLQLNHNISGSIPDSIGYMTSLATLLLDYNSLTGPIPASMGMLKNMSLCDLAENQLGDSIPASFDSLPALTYLSISDNDFTFAGMEGLVKAYSGVSFGYDGQGKVPLLKQGTILAINAGGTLSNNTYTWFKNGEAVATTVGDPTYTITAPGIYFVMVSNSLCTQLILTSGSDTVNSLPVVLMSFTATKSKGQNLLQWVTAQETNSSYFGIERSIDGEHFASIGTVAAKGNTDIQSNYSFIDENPQTGINYYRLKMVDKDGDFVYSDTKTINGQAAFASLLYPNPAKNSVGIVTTASQGQKAQIQVVDMLGRTVLVTNVNITAGTSTNAVDISSLGSGSYFITIKTTEGEKTLRFIKEN